MSVKPRPPLSRPLSHEGGGHSYYHHPNPFYQRIHKPRPRSRPRLLLPFSPAQQSSEPTPSSPLSSPSPVQVQWAPGLVRLEDLLYESPLPQLVRCRTQGLQDLDGGPLAVPLENTPILLAERRSARHLLARIVLYDDNTGGFHESVDSVVIPEDYEGCFLRLQSRTTKDKTRVKSLETIAHDDTPAFLNLSDITSFPVYPRNPDDKSRFIYTVGNVFLVDEPLPSKETQFEETGTGNAQPIYSTVSDISEHKSARSSASGRGSNGMMKCLDERGMPILVPTNQVGEMVTVQKNGEGQPRLSVKSRDLMANQQFPLLARYAYGKTRPRLTAFSKLLTLLDSFQETSLIGCILNPSSMMLVEIPLASSLSFQVASNLQDLLPRAPRLRRALEACRKQGRELCRDIKFKYKFSHRVQENSRRVKKVRGQEDDDDDLPSATVRTRLVVTETYVYI